jgi:hypothetical protein
VGIGSSSEFLLKIRGSFRMFTQTPQSISQEYELNFLQIAGSVRNCCNWFMGQNDSWSDSEWQNDPPSYEWWWPVADFRLLILFAIAIFSNLMTRHERRNLPSHGPVFAKVTDEIMTSSWLWRNDLLNEALKNRPCGWLTWNFTTDVHLLSINISDPYYVRNIANC